MTRGVCRILSDAQLENYESTGPAKVVLEDGWGYLMRFDSQVSASASAADFPTLYIKIYFYHSCDWTSCERWEAPRPSAYAGTVAAPHTAFSWHHGAQSVLETPSELQTADPWRHIIGSNDREASDQRLCGPPRAWMSDVALKFTENTSRFVRTTSGLISTRAKGHRPHMPPKKVLIFNSGAFI